jgi:hypothetical protein
VGVIVCSKHGKSGFRETCEHVSTELGVGRYAQSRRAEFWLNMLVCDECWEEHDFARFESHPDITGKPFYEADEDSPTFQEYSRVYEGLRRRCWCVKCIAEIRANAAGDGGDAAQQRDEPDSQ